MIVISALTLYASAEWSMLINDTTDFGFEEDSVVIDGVNSYDLRIIESRLCDVTTKSDEVDVFDATIVVSEFSRLFTINTQMTSNEWVATETQRVDGDITDNERVSGHWNTASGWRHHGQW